MNQQEAIEEAKKRGLKWVAMDQDGAWYGYKSEPLFDEVNSEWSDLSSPFFLGLDNTWRESLTEVK